MAGEKQANRDLETVDKPGTPPRDEETCDASVPATSHPTVLAANMKNCGV